MKSKIKKSLFLMKCLAIFFVMFFCSTKSYSQKEEFNCNIFKMILKGIEEQKDKLKIYKSIKDKVYITTDSTLTNLRVVNQSNIPDKVIDSLVKLSDFVSITDDSLYYFKSQNIIVDTFMFFTKDCDCLSNGSMFLFDNKKPNKINSLNTNIIEVRGINIKNDQLIINLKNPKSKFSIYFYFNLVFNSPTLSKVRSAYTE